MSTVTKQVSAPTSSELRSVTMPTPVLNVETDAIRRIDTRNVENLLSIWTLFSRCSGSIEEGRRLENLSWRLWNRETFCCAPGEAYAITSAISISQRRADIPDLSGSIDSMDEEAIEFDNEESASTSAPLTITRPRVRRQDSSCNRSRGKERHITPDDLEKMVITIKEKKDLKPLTMSTHSYIAPLASKITSPQLSNTASPTISAPEPEKAASLAPSSPASTTTDSASAALERNATSVVCGFSLSQISSSYCSMPSISTPASAPKSALLSNMSLAAPKKHAMFALCGSSQSNSDSFQESSLDSWMQQSKKNKARSNMLQLSDSSAEDKNLLRDSMQRSSHRSSLSDALRRLEQKKQTYLKEEAHPDQYFQDQRRHR